MNEDLERAEKLVEGLIGCRVRVDKTYQDIVLEKQIENFPVGSSVYRVWYELSIVLRYVDIDDKKSLAKKIWEVVKTVPCGDGGLETDVCGFPVEMSSWQIQDWFRDLFDVDVWDLED
jgi:hypothetical protein